MSNDPEQRRLKLARSEIEAIIQKHDVGAHVILHRPGWSEHFANYSPSYSKLKLENGAYMRVRSKLVDYDGDKEAQRRDMNDTVNLVVHFAECLAQNALAMAAVHAMLAKQFEIDILPGRREPDFPTGENQP